VFFVSDAHFGLGGDEGERIARFSEFAAEVRRRGSDLYVVGDMFDFWIEYRSAIRRDYFPALYELRRMADSGVRVHYVAGNHDFALGNFLEESAGVSVHRGCVDVELQGRKVHISHGDKVCCGPALRIAGRLLRCGFLRALYKVIHPDIGIWFGSAVSAASKRHRGAADIPDSDLEKYRQAARTLMNGGKRDLVVFAHTHHAELISLDGGEYCNTGSWMRGYDYAALRDGKIQLLKWGSSAS
jgi:UDP-2,3-diacylglucosamine hydrolase